MRQKDERYNVSDMFPQNGDPRKPPAWLGRALLMVVITVFVAFFVWWAWGLISWIVVDLVICLFLALAMEPAILFFIRHGWGRGTAAGLVWFIVLAVTVGLITLFGSMFISQVIGLVENAPRVYSAIVDIVSRKTPWKLPDINDLGSSIASSIQISSVADFAGQAVSTTSIISNFLLQLMIVILVTYYVAAAGPVMRRSICSLLRPDSQQKFLVVWTVVQGQISSFLNSRIILASISSVVNGVMLIALHVPYWLPLCLSYAIISQFIPMVGAFIGAILPIVVAWTSNGPTTALIVTIFILVYQQIENMVIGPKIQQRTMSVHPAVGLLAVFVFGAIFGVLGSFLALPITASIQVIFSAYMKRTDIIDSPLLHDPKPVRKSKVVQATETFSDNVLKPLADHLPRSAKGTTGRVTTDMQLSDVERAAQKYSSSEDLDSSETTAIPQKNAQHRSDRAHSQSSRSKRALWGTVGNENPPQFEAEETKKSEKAKKGDSQSTKAADTADADNKVDKNGSKGASQA